MNHVNETELNLFYRYWFTTFESVYMWMKKGHTRDKHIEKKYTDLYNRIKSLSMREMMKIIKESKNQQRTGLAFILMLDQIPRHLFRSSKKAFGTDKKALQLSYNVRKIYYPEKEYTNDEYLFYSLPFQHSTRIMDQEFIIECIKDKKKLCLSFVCKKPLDELIYYAKKHSETLKEFGYYPKRKLITGEKLTKRDKVYIETRNKDKPF